MSSVASYQSSVALAAPRANEAELSWTERALLALAIWEIPLQLDKYLLFRQEDSELGALAGINVSVTTCCLAVLYAFWLFKASVHRSRTSHRVMLGIPMLTYMAFVGLSSVAASVPVLAVFDLLMIVQAYGLFFYIANRIRTQEGVHFCLYVLAAVLLTQSVLVFGLAGLGGAGHGQRYDIGPLSLSVWEDGRVAGTLVSAVVCGSVMAFLWMPVVAMSLTVRSQLLWLFVTIAALAGSLAVLLTQTRGAILAMTLGSFILGISMLWRRWLPRWTMYGVVAVAIVGAYPLTMVVKNRVIGDDNGSAESRKHLSLIALEMIQDRPLFGFGAGNCHLAAQDYADQAIYRSEWYYTVHSKYLLTWIELGIFGLISFMAILGNTLRYAFQVWMSRDRLLAPLGIAIIGAMLGSMLHMSVDIFNSRSQVQLLWVMVGITTAMYRMTCLQPDLASARRAELGR